MPPADAAVLYVCTGCNFSKSVEEKHGRRGGHVLYHAILDALGQAPPPVHIEPVACLSVCRDACAAALTAPGKYAYTFGWLCPDREAAADVLAMAALYAAAPDGHVDRRSRPAATRRLISKVPPPGFDPDIDDDSRNPRMAERVAKPPRP